MKTKIIYISGSEVFDVNDIRGAFEEVRNALGLGKDTVLFGVPVDADDAGLSQVTTVQTPAPEITVTVEPIDKEEIEEVKPKRVRKTKAKDEEIIEVIAKDEEEPIVAIAETVTETEEAVIEEEKIIPILSILSSKSDDDNVLEPEVITEPVSEPETITQSVTIEQEIITTQSVTIEDIATDEEPISAMEKTLEHLLETMAPLREDLNEEDTTTLETIEIEPEVEEDTVIKETDTNTDATLEKLAAEFATKQDEIISTPNMAPVGKIGKLKNILPFKKAKREESGLMSDLFGWAGIAANDDEFSIPGFFTTSASKK